MFAAWNAAVTGWILLNGGAEGKEALVVRLDPGLDLVFG
jgi:hypothetical protein